MYCRNCGNQIPDDSSFCPHCGTKVVTISPTKPIEEKKPEIIEPVQEETTDVTKPIQSDQPEIHVEMSEDDSSNTTKTKGLILIGIIIVAMMALGIVLNVVGRIINKDSSKSEDKIEEIEKEDTESKEDSESKEETKTSDSSSQTTNTTENTQQAVDNTANDYIIPDSSTRVISESELYNLTQDECCFARNEIYARHNRLFSTDYIQAYFNTKSWYNGYISPDNFTSDMLNDVEMQNVMTILNYEQRMGWQ